MAAWDKTLGEIIPGQSQERKKGWERRELYAAVIGWNRGIVLTSAILYSISAVNMGLHNNEQES